MRRLFCPSGLGFLRSKKSEDKIGVSEPLERNERLRMGNKPKKILKNFYYYSTILSQNKTSGYTPGPFTKRRIFATIQAWSYIKKFTTYLAEKEKFWPSFC